MKIAEVSEKFGLSLDTLRYYERIGLIPTVTRTSNGIRNYSEVDISRVEFIKCMRSAGLPIDVLIDYVALVDQGDTTIEARKEILIEQRELLIAKIADLQKTLDVLDYKISLYERKNSDKKQMMVLVEKSEA
jgi:MerR family transcriptional regulator, aldehyde-responsive regulator